MKKAIIAGLNYRNTQNELPDCELDAENMAAKCQKAGFTVEKFTVMTGARLKSIFEGLKNDPPGELLFYYSGHGTQYPMQGEADGMEEAICLWNGRGIELFSDNLMKACLESIPCKVTAIFDSCFSGGMDRNAFRPIGTTRRFATVIPPETALFTLPKIERATTNATTYLFASQEGELSNSTGIGGAFTLALLNADKMEIRTAGGIITYAQQTIDYQHARLFGDAERLVFGEQVADLNLPTVNLRNVFKTSLDVKKLPEYLIIHLGQEIGASVDERLTRNKNAEILFKAIYP